MWHDSFFFFLFFFVLIKSVAVLKLSHYIYLCSFCPKMANANHDQKQFAQAISCLPFNKVFSDRNTSFQFLKVY